MCCYVSLGLGKFGMGLGVGLRMGKDIPWSEARILWVYTRGKGVF